MAVIAGATLGLAVGVLSMERSGAAADYRPFSTCCDASAAVALNSELFAVASDEDNILRLFLRESGGSPVRAVDVSGFLGLGRKQEADLEGAARLGDRVYWVGSHSRNKDGQHRPGRHVLFATAIVGEGKAAELRPVGRPFRGLVRAFSESPLLAGLQLGQAAERPGEDSGGLNIEGLAAGPQGELLVGFRNPVPDDRALWVPLLNPQGVTEGQPARLGQPQHLDLGGLSVRDMVQAGGRYFIIAGPAEGGGRHRLFQWSGGVEAPVEIPKAIPKSFQAESMLVDEPGLRFLDLLSDDGGEKVAGRDCSDLNDPAQRRFRSLRVVLGSSGGADP